MVEAWLVSFQREARTPPGSAGLRIYSVWEPMVSGNEESAVIEKRSLKCRLGLVRQLMLVS